MTTEQFKAFTQYEDLSGTVAADHAEKESILDWLSTQVLLKEGPNLIGTKLYFTQLPASGEPYVVASFLLALSGTNLGVRIPGAEEPPTVVVRRIRREISLVSFMTFFKNLELTLSSDSEFEGLIYGRR